MQQQKSYFHYKSLIKASRLLIFGTYILFNICYVSDLNEDYHYNAMFAEHVDYRRVKQTDDRSLRIYFC